MTEPSAKDHSSEDAPIEEESAETRTSRLRRIRKQIQDGTYDSDERIDEALRRMLAQMTGDED